MKRRIVLFFVTLAFLAAAGAALSHTEPAVDAGTGASERIVRIPGALGGVYALMLNPSRAALSDASVREAVKRLPLDDASGLSAGHEFTLYVEETDTGLTAYANLLAARAWPKGTVIRVRPVSRTMIRSRELFGEYDALLLAEDLIDTDALKTADHVLLDAEEMR